MTHHGAGVGVELIGAELLVAALVAAAVAYVGAAARPHRPVAWPVGRTVRWVTGVVVAVAGIVGPLLLPVTPDLPVHVAGHLLVGMIAPLLLVTAAPVTLALRVLPQRASLACWPGLLRLRPVVVLTHPVVAAVVDVGGLWLLYRTDLHAALPPAVVHLHMLLAGYLFAFSLVGRDPAPHRPGLAVRAGVLVAAVAAHDVLAKLLYAAQAETAGLLMLLRGRAGAPRPVRAAGAGVVRRSGSGSGRGLSEPRPPR